MSPPAVNNVGMIPSLLPSHFLNTPDDIQVYLCFLGGVLSAGPGEGVWTEFCTLEGVWRFFFLLILVLGPQQGIIVHGHF